MIAQKHFFPSAVCKFFVYVFDLLKIIFKLEAALKSKQKIHFKKLFNNFFKALTRTPPISFLIQDLSVSLLELSEAWY